MCLVGCVLPFVAPHGEMRGTFGVAVGRTRSNAAVAARPTGNLDIVWLPTVVLGCDREFDLALGARFHFVEAEREGVQVARIGGVLSGAWLYLRDGSARGELRFDASILELDRRALGNVTASLGIELLGTGSGSGTSTSPEGLFVSEWTGEAALRAEIVLGYYEDFASVRYGTATFGISIRWPMGAGVFLVNPLNDISQSRANDTSSVGPPRGLHACGDDPVALADDEPPIRSDDQRGNYLCHVGDPAQSERINSSSLAGAYRACRLMLGVACECSRDLPQAQTIESTGNPSPR